MYQKQKNNMKFKIFLLLFFISALVFQSCQKEPTACFDISKNNIAVGDTLHFSFCSLNDNSCKWEFGDGTSSSLERPEKIYNSAGTFRIILTVYTEGGKKSDTLSKVVTVNGSAPSIQITVKNLMSLSLIGNINVKLFSNLSDWQNMTSPVASGVTDNTGKIFFSNLSEAQYFIRAENVNYTNFNLGNSAIEYILTDTLIENDTILFTAWVQTKPAYPTSLHITVRTAFSPQNVVPNINVKLYTNYTDWQNASNPVANGFTNTSGIVVFNTNLNSATYFVRVESPQLNNVQAGMSNQNLVKTNVLVADTANYYTAYVDQNTQPPTSLQIDVKQQGGMPPQQPVPNITVTLYNNYNDWLNQTSPVMSGITNISGIAVFTTNLLAVQYYVRAENAQFTNLAIGQMNQNNIMTPTIILNIQNYFTAFVKQPVK